MDNELLEYKVGEHDAKLKEHDVKFKENDMKISENEKNYIRLSQSVDELTNSIKSVASIGKWLIGLFATELVGFFFAILLKLF